MKDSEDTLLVRQCLNGERRAFEAVVEKYQKPLFNITYRLLDSFDDAEDVTQAAFIKAFEKLHTYSSRYKLFSWLYRIAINESLNFLNAKKHNQVLDERIVSGDESPEKKYVERELEKNLQDAIAKLSTEYRTVIILRHFQELSYEEISEVLEIPVKTVKSRLFTSRQQLKEILIRQM